MNRIEILGVRISNISQDNALERIREFLLSRTQHYIVTPNPEIILETQKDEELFFILNKADLTLGDGFGLKIASWIEGKNLKRITGSDLTISLLNIASKEKIKIGILLWNKGLSSKKDVEKNLKEKYPGIDFVVATMNRDKNSTIDKDFINFEPKIVFVCFGAPWQEKFIYHNLKNIPSAKIMLGVGGTFDFITDKAKRAPKFLRALGLEWFWRLIKQPTRLKRIIRAVIIFPYIFAVDKFYHPLFYRPNVACLLYKKEKDKYKILVVERMGESGHWQLPQGGTDGQCLLEAGTRELCEEVNCNEVIPKRVFKNLYKYQFGTRPGENSERVNTCRKHTGYKGQKQGLLIAEFVGQDSDIKINFWDHSDWKWVEANKLVDEVHVIRKRATEKFLKKFKEFVKEK